MRCNNCNNEINNNATFCPVCGSIQNVSTQNVSTQNVKKRIGALSIISIIITALILLVTVGLIVYCSIGMEGAGVETKQGYTWGLIIGTTILGCYFAYYLIVTIISIVLDKKLVKRTGKNIGVIIALLLPIICTVLFLGFIFITNTTKSFTVGSAKVEFPSSMNQTSSRSGFTGGYSMLEFYERNESNATCSILISYGSKKGTSAINNMIENGDDTFVDKNVSLESFLKSSYSTKKTTINDVTWDYLEYNSYSNKYFKIYGTEYKGNYYVVQVNDSHKDHKMCKENEGYFMNRISFK